ncbi:hypothetical protein HDU96_003677 [Phlyctochytrium bullatum]|nr:hypothetical protein HDU96_003677 [Phlyctochytrium bullatum]
MFRLLSCLFAPLAPTPEKQQQQYLPPLPSYGTMASAASGISAAPAHLPEAAEEIKEFHFHIYWLTKDATAKKAAMDLRQEVIRLNDAKFFVAVPLFRVNEEPMGPHPVGSYEVWVPTEYFARVYQWLARHRPQNVSILIHPLSKEQLLDHTDRVAFLGQSMPLYTEALQPPVLDDYPLQYPELGLGYSAPPK